MCSKFTYLSVLMSVVSASEFNIFPNLPVTVETSDNSICKRESEQLIDNLKNFTLWAFEMRDATAKSAYGVLRGNGYNMGYLQECLTAQAPFPTQFCLPHIIANIPQTKTHRDPYSLDYDPYEHVINKLYDYKDETKVPRNVAKLGWCIPASCSPEDAEKSLNNYLTTYDHPLLKENVTFSAVVPPIFCQASNNQRKLDGADLSFCVLTGMLILLVVIATILDSTENRFGSRKERGTMKILLAFSAKTNFKDLNKPDDSEKPLRILYGLKTFCALMIIAGHRFALFFGQPLLNFDDVEREYRKVLSSGLYHADMFVDTFFFIGGLLATYIIMGLVEKNKFNPVLLIVNRYLRLTPSYAFIIFFHATLLYHTGNGVFWEPMIGSERQDCRDSWWTGILYVSNLVNPEHMCMVQSWYLPCDFHFFMIALPLIYILHKNKRIGFTAIVICCLATIVTTFFILYINERQAYLRFLPAFLSGPKSFIDFHETYITTYTRGLPYFTGMIAGYVYYTLKGTDFKISKFHSLILLYASYFLICVLLFTAVIFYSPYHVYNALESAMYGSIHRLLWALGTFAFVYSVSFGPPGLLYNFFSWTAFIPFSKLSYGAYLSHIAIIIRDFAITPSPRIFIHFNLISIWMSDIVIAYAISLALYLAVEGPFKKIIRILLFPESNSNSAQNLTSAVDVKLESSAM